MRGFLSNILIAHENLLYEEASGAWNLALKVKTKIYFNF